MTGWTPTPPGWTPTPRAGLYPDPENPGALRYWDGKAWEKPGYVPPMRIPWYGIGKALFFAANFGFVLIVFRTCGGPVI